MTGRPGVRVLLVEDDATMAKLIRTLLEADGYTQVKHVYTGAQALQAAADAEIILLDHQLPDTRGLELLPQLLARADPPSVVMVTGHGTESLAAAALRQGAEDYLAKDHTLPELLPRILERVRRHRSLRRALDEAERDLVRTERLAAIGEMTVTLHHEVNNPLMAALAEVELALADPGLPETHREGLGSAKTALLRIRDTIRRAGALRAADTKGYLDRVQMIDLESQPSEPATYLGRAVLHATDQRLARVLALLLTQAGFGVERCPSARDLVSAVEASGVVLVVVAIKGDESEPLAGFRPAPSRRFTLVVLGPNEASARSAGADLALVLPFDPATLVGEIRGAIAARG
jgi:DNA-binding response OmpR family regulator